MIINCFFSPEGAHAQSLDNSYSKSPSHCDKPSFFHAHDENHILSKDTRVKKGKAKSEAPKVILFIYSTKKIDIMQVEAKACITDRICKHHNNFSYVNAYIMCIIDNSYKHNYSLLLGHIFSNHILPSKCGQVTSYNYVCKQWCSYGGVHKGIGPTISLCGPTINNLTNHMHGVYNNIYFNYTLQIPSC